MPGNTEIVDLAERIVPLQGVSIPELSPIISTLSLPEDHDTSVPSSTTFPCECKFSPCYSNFDPDEIQDIRHQYIALTDKELDIALLSRKLQQTERKASRTDYLLHGHRICRKFFLYIHNIGLGKLTSLIKHYKENGVKERIHKSKKRLPHNALMYQDTRKVVDYIVNYAEANAIELPGRTPRHWITNAKLLPTSCTKATVYEFYKAATVKSVGTRTR